MIDTKGILVQRFTNFLIKSLLHLQIDLLLLLTWKQGINFNSENQQLAKAYASQLLECLRRMYSPFKDNIWDFDLADMQLINKNYKGIWFLLWAIDI